SFFIPAVSALLHPEMIPAILKPGRHEIAVHGWIHEYPPTIADAAEEERLLNKAIDFLTKAANKRPVGYRAPSWAFSEHTLDLVRKSGFLYDSSLMAMDEPYEVMSNGEATGLVELAIDWTLTETPYLGRGGTMPSPEKLFQLYREEFDGAYEDGTLFVLTLHPHVVGHRAPMRYLNELIVYMKSKPGVWFAAVEQILEQRLIPLQAHGGHELHPVAIGGLVGRFGRTVPNRDIRLPHGEVVVAVPAGAGIRLVAFQLGVDQHAVGEIHLEVLG